MTGKEIPKEKYFLRYECALEEGKRGYYGI